jgi:glycosyltransferase involved in cell wall biosynthesis
MSLMGNYNQLSTTPDCKQLLVSVVIPAYCSGRYIARSLTSVLAQTYNNIEVLVVDDGSTDETAEIVREFAKIDSRVILLSQPNQGVAAARNLAIRNAKGEFIAPLDADDVWLPENLEKQVASLVLAGESCGVAYSWSLDIDENDQPLESFHAYKIEGDVYVTLLCHNFLGNASCTLIRKSCLDDVGLYTTTFKETGFQGCEDWDLYLRIAAKYTFVAVPEFLIRYRKSTQAMSSNCDSMFASYSLVLEHSERRLSVPKFARRLSISSFCIHLAHQSAAQGDFREAVLWLSKAVSTDCITPFLRIEVYGLLCKALFMNLAPVPFLPIQRCHRLSVRKPNSTKMQMSLLWRQLLGSLMHEFLKLASPQVRELRVFEQSDISAKILREKSASSAKVRDQLSKVGS